MISLVQKILCALPFSQSPPGSSSHSPHTLHYQARAARLRRDPTLVQHGSENGYKNWGCRCAPCARAHSDYVAHMRWKNGRRRLEDGVGHDG